MSLKDVGTVRSGTSTFDEVVVGKRDGTVKRDQEGRNELSLSLSIRVRDGSDYK